MFKRPAVLFFTAMICCALWGSAFPCIKIGYGLFHIASDDPASQILFAGIRFFMAGCLVVLFYSIGGRRAAVPERTSWGMIAKLAVFQTVLQYVFFYLGLAHTTGVKASIIDASNVFISILLAAFIFRQEKITTGKAAGCLLGFAGVVLVNLTGSGLDAQFSFAGEGFILISAAASSVSSVLIKAYSQKESPVILSGYQFILGGLTMIAAGAVMGGSLGAVTLKGCALLLYMAMISAVAYSLWGTLLKYNPVSRVTVFGFLNPFFGVFLSAVLLTEENSLPWLQCISALVMVCAGIYIVNREPEQGTTGNNMGKSN